MTPNEILKSYMIVRLITPEALASRLGARVQDVQMALAGITALPWGCEESLLLTLDPDPNHVAQIVKLIKR
jgi:hypothetical protein